MRLLRLIVIISVGATLLPHRLFAQHDVCTYAGVQTALERHGVHFVRGNRAAVLPTGVEKFEDMFCAIRQARHYIHLEYFNFRNDSIGHALFTLLGEKAAEGVKVRALFDGYGNDSNSRPLRGAHIDSIRSMGIEICEYDPVCFLAGDHAFHRDHRKIVVIDGALVYTGGMNVADYYLKGDPAYGEWRDMHFRIEGPSVDMYEGVFAWMWTETTGQSIDWMTGRRMARAPDFAGLKPCVEGSDFMLGLVDRKPGINGNVMRRSYETLLDSARHHIQFVTPYFSPTTRMWRAMKRALKRGVRMEIMVSVDGDLPIVPSVVAYRMNILRKLGAEVYYYKGGFHHSKIMMIDDRLCSVGSSNLNARSMLFDHEVNAVILDAAVTGALSDIFEADKARCTLLDSENRRSVISNRRLMVGRIANAISWLL